MILNIYLNCIAGDGLLTKGPMQQNTWTSVGKQIYQHWRHTSHERVLYKWEYEALERSLLHKPMLVGSPTPGPVTPAINDLGQSHNSSITRTCSLLCSLHSPWGGKTPSSRWHNGFLYLNSSFQQLSSCPLVASLPDGIFAFLKQLLWEANINLLSWTYRFLLLLLVLFQRAKKPGLPVSHVTGKPEEKLTERLKC